MKVAIVVPSPSLGDGFIMSVAAYNFWRAGNEVVLFSNSSLISLKSWMGFLNFKNLSNLEELKEFDLIILEHNNHPLAYQIADKREHLKQLLIFYTSYKETKHGKLKPLDFVCDKDKTIVENVINMCKKQLPKTTSESGMTIPESFVHKRFLKRVIIHPTSGSEDKNWPLKKFISLAKKIKKEGFDPIIISNEALPIKTIQFSNLQDLIAYIYESRFFIGNDSAPAHFASYLQIPFIVITKLKEALWNPGWKKGIIVTPPNWMPNIKYFRLKENKWKYFISVNKVFKAFKTC